MIEPTLTPRALLHRTIQQVATEHHLDPVLIEGHSRVPRALHARAVVAARLFDHFDHSRKSINMIARMMKLNRATVLDYLRQVLPQQEDDHDARQGGTEGSAEPHAAAAAAFEKQGADRQEHEGQGQVDWQDHEHQGGHARRRRARSVI